MKRSLQYIKQFWHVITSTRSNVSRLLALPGNMFPRNRLHCSRSLMELPLLTVELQHCTEKRFPGISSADDVSLDAAFCLEVFLTLFLSPWFFTLTIFSKRPLVTARRSLWNKRNSLKPGRSCSGCRPRKRGHFHQFSTHLYLNSRELKKNQWMLLAMLACATVNKSHQLELLYVWEPFSTNNSAPLSCSMRTNIGLIFQVKHSNYVYLLHY